MLGINKPSLLANPIYGWDTYECTKNSQIVNAMVSICVSADSQVSSLDTKIVSEYDQEIPQSQTADNPVTPRGRAAQTSRDTTKTN